MQISRRGALLGAGAAAVVAGVPGAVDATSRAVLAVFRQLNPVRQDIILGTMRLILETQRSNESRGFTIEDDARAARDLERLAGDAGA